MAYSTRLQLTKDRPDVAGNRLLENRMTLLQPKTLWSTLAPSLLIHQVLLLGITHHAAGRIKRRLGLVYSATICILYGVAIFACCDPGLPRTLNFRNSIATSSFIVFLLVNCCLSIANVAITILRNKDLDDCVTELMDIDKAIKKLGGARPYGPLLMQHTIQLLASILLFLMSSMLYHSLTSQNVLVWSIIWHSITHSTLVLIVGDNAFCIFNRVITERFEDLNLLLKSMGIQNEDDYNARMGTLIRVEAILADKKKLEKLKLVRKIYTRLYDLAKRWTELNEVRIVHSVVAAMFGLTFHSHNMYTKYMIPNVQPHLHRVSSDVTYLCLYMRHILRLFMIVSPAAALTAEAKKTRRILLAHLQPIAYIRSEVHQFSWDLLQDPMRLSVRELFNLDYTLLQMIVGTVATCLVFLVQTENL